MNGAPREPVEVPVYIDGPPVYIERRPRYIKTRSRYIDGSLRNAPR
jgi:hypothetical protein